MKRVKRRHERVCGEEKEGPKNGLTRVTDATTAQQQTCVGCCYVPGTRLDFLWAAPSPSKQPREEVSVMETRLEKPDQGCTGRSAYNFVTVALIPCWMDLWSVSLTTM